MRRTGKGSKATWRWAAQHSKPIKAADKIEPGTDLEKAARRSEEGGAATWNVDGRGARGWAGEDSGGGTGEGEEREREMKLERGRRRIGREKLGREQ